MKEIINEEDLLPTDSELLMKYMLDREPIKITQVDPNNFDEVGQRLFWIQYGRLELLENLLIQLETQREDR